MHRAATAICLFLFSSIAGAQQPSNEPAPLPREPKPAFVFDARLGWPALDQDAGVATALRVSTDDLPGRGRTMIFGGHFYAARRNALSFGAGAEMLWHRASHTATVATTQSVDERMLKNRWSLFSPQVSLNFGTRDGWSYLTGGLGWSKLTMERQDEPQDSGGSLRTLNYGGGARWFIKKHLAFNMDARFYSIGAQEAATRRVATPKMRVFLISGGVSFR